MGESGSVRQLSNASAALLAVALGALLVVASLPLSAGVFVFSPLLLAVTCGMTVKGILAYPFRRELRLAEPAGLFLGSWAVAVPLAALAAPACELLARRGPHLLRWGPTALGPEWTARLAGVAAVLLVVGLFVSIKSYAATPSEARFEGELAQKGPPLLLLVLGANVFGLAVAFAGPFASVMAVELAARRATPGLRLLAQGVGLLSVLPALVVGLAILRRAFSMRQIQWLIDGHPRSTAGAAAAGLVELHGTAQPLDPGANQGPLLLLRDSTAPGPKRVAGSFYLDDGTGRVRVAVPDDARPGRDGTIDLVGRSRPQGLQPEYVLMPGDPIYVLGEFRTSENGREIRSWAPPCDGFMEPLVRDLFLQDWSLWGLDWAEVLDLKTPAGVFAITDAGEARLRRIVRRRWIRSLSLGVLMLAGAAAYVARVAP